VHILSKIFVVVAAVLSVLLSGLTMAYAVNADRVLADYSAEQARRQSAEGNLRAETEGASVERSRLNASISDLNNALAARDSQIRELQTGVAREIAAKRDAQSQRDEILNKTKVLEETSRTQAKLLEGYRTEVTSLRDSEVVFRQRELELEDRINDLESQREVLEQTMRALQEQLSEVRTTLAGAQTGSTSSAGAAARPFVDSGTLITARIEKIEKDPASGALYATINAGTNDRIRDNMQLYIGRNNEFIGHLIITKTDLNHAIGRIDLLGRSVAVQSGDTVLSRLR
jgi:DNA repair exonuclease SbcCD ATPase subunit